ncbi:MAG TPA: tetratricopeptide repeat protein [Gemmataceae bacterium]|nr:tetratricopeptide repeat protein [Gemmataceae bacterium]
MTAKTRKEKLQAMLADEPHDPELLYMLAMEHVSEGNDEQAVRTFQELLAHAPEHIAAYHQAARALQRLGQLTQARATLQSGIPIALKNGDTHAAGEMQGLLDMLD